MKRTFQKTFIVLLLPCLLGLSITALAEESAVVASEDSDSPQNNSESIKEETNANKKEPKVIKNTGLQLPFSDDFERGKLGENYTIENLDEDRVILSEGKLLIVTTQPTKNSVKIQPKISGDFEASVKITIKLTKNNWASFGFYADNKNYVRLGYAVNSISYGAIDFAKGIRGKTSNRRYTKNIGSRVLNSASRKQKEDWYFKIKKQKFNFTAYASIDGKNWTSVGEHTLLKKEGNIVFIVGGSGVEDSVLFDDIKINKLSSTE